MKNKTSVILSVEGISVSVNPLYGEDVKMKIKKDSGEAYFRESLEGTFRFLKDDYDKIKSWPVDTKFTLVYMLGEHVAGKGFFYKEECVFDEDNRICEVKVTSTDRYTKLLAGIDNEYNLIKLAPRQKSLHLVKRPALQVYVKGGQKLSYIYGNQTFETDCEETNDEQALLDMHFAQIPVPRWDVVGGNSWIATASQSKRGVAHEWKMVLSLPNAYDTPVYYFYFLTDGEVHSRYDVYNVNTGTIVPNIYIESYVGITKVTDFAFEMVQDGYYLGSNVYKIYARWISPIKNVSGVDVFDIPQEDITDKNLNYKYCFPADDSTVEALDVSKYLDVSFLTQEEPTEYGTNSVGDYFIAPYPISDDVETILPIAWDSWLPGSYWFHSPCYEKFWILADRAMQEEYTLKDAYSLIDAIRVLIQEIDGSIKFDDSEAYSQFLTTQPCSRDWKELYPNFLRTLGRSLYITPITNVKETQYTQAAQKGTITLKQVLDMLKYCFRCYWWIDEDNRFRIEHISAINNGGDYISDERNIIFDLTENKSMPTEKVWDYNSNKSEENEGAVSRYEFGWNEETTREFNGFPIDFLHVSRGTKESINVANFNSDVDYIVLNPSNVTNDCFVLLEADNTSFRVPIDIVGDERENFGPHHGMQNGLLSFLSLERTYYTYDMPNWCGKVRTPSIYINDKWRTEGTIILANNVRKDRKQKVLFPCLLSDIDVTGLVKTSLGNGVLNDVEYSTDSGSCNMVLEQASVKDYRAFIETASKPEREEAHIYTRVSITNNFTDPLRVKYILTNGSTVIPEDEQVVAGSTTISTRVGGSNYRLIVTKVEYVGPAYDTKTIYNSGTLVAQVRKFEQESDHRINNTLHLKNNSVLPVRVYRTIIQGGQETEDTYDLDALAEVYITRFGEDVRFIVTGFEYR